MKTTFMAVLLAMLLLTAPLYAKEEPEIKEKASRSVELYKFSNEDLLKQAESAFNEASADFHTLLRGVYGHEVLLKNAREKASAIQIPEKPVQTIPAAQEADPLESVKADAEYAKSRVEAFKQYLEVKIQEKEILDTLFKILEEAASAAANFMNTIEGLNIFQLEIRWRTEDGTLSPDKVPDFINTAKMEAEKQKILGLDNILKLKTAIIRKDLETLAGNIEDIRKTLIEAEAAQASADEKYSHELKRRTLEKEYADQSPEKLIGQISDLQEERVWLNGAFNLTRGRYGARKARADEIQQQIESMSPPEPFVIHQGVVQPEEMEKVITHFESIITYHNDRIRQLEQYRSALKSLIEHAEAFQGDAIVLSEHLFKMQVIAAMMDQAARQGSLSADAIPQNMRSEVLGEAGRSVSEWITEVMSIVGKSGKQITTIEDEIKKSEDARSEANAKIAAFNKSYESAIQTQKWEADLKDLSAQDIVLKFKENHDKLIENSDILKVKQKEYEKAEHALDEIHKKFESLKDPMLRAAREASLKEKQNIAKTLYEIAGLELPADTLVSESDSVAEKKGAAEESSKKDAEGKPVKESEKKEDEKKEASASAQSVSYESEMNSHQNLLSTRSRIIEEQQKLRQQQMNALTSLDKVIKDYADAVQEIRKLAINQHTSAVELKKRLGRSELKTEEVPEGITEALKSDLKDELETRIVEIVSNQMLVQDEIKKLGTQDETLENIKVLLSEIQKLFGKRMDMFHKLQNLKQSFERTRDSLSATELKSLEQKAVRRMYDEDMVAEFIVGFVPSERAESLTTLLQAYYMDLTEFEDQREILKSQKETVDQLVQFAEQEKKQDTKLLPLLHQQSETLKLALEEEWIKIKIQFMPEKSKELLDAFEAKTGRRISMPPPLMEEDKKNIIEKKTESLFSHQADIVAARNWINFFEKRLSASGIDMELSRYQERIGEMNSTSASVDRAIWRLTGYPSNEIAKLADNEKPKTEAAKLRIEKGQIGAVRAERYNVRRESVLIVIGKLLAILLIAFIATWIVNKIIGWMSARSQKSANTMLSLLPFFKTVFVFFIWITSILSCLSTLGFNVGAILAGLGIGGLAIAMASKETVSDILGGISILLSKSFKIGDKILFNNEKAKVEYIGIRYTKLRHDTYNYLITVPNSLLAQNAAIDTLVDKPFYVSLKIPLSIQNSMEDTRKAIQMITDMINNAPEAKLRDVFLTSFQNYRFDIRIRYIILDYGMRYTLRSRIHTEIIGKLKENNIKIAAVPHMDVGA